MTNIDTALLEIAKKFFHLTTLEEQNCSDDFREVAVWNMAEALKVACEAGKTPSENVGGWKDPTL
ncbi:hypothetical protein NKW43_15075 [Gluconobacter albidus]|uniref:DUF6900 domain-containing protein n=1 Tax=Gluconobacter albidus TaxID=318683 RepID=UPI00209F3FB0|nr:hypothetical protein [Gluconobacter albidus]MCP1274983.1 hypothetical protein [Gluconobacter albidus]